MDNEVDARLDAMIEDADDASRSRLGALKGKAAIANAKLAYALFQRPFSGERWEKLRAKPVPACSARSGPAPASRTRPIVT